MQTSLDLHHAFEEYKKKDWGLWIAYRFGDIDLKTYDTETERLKEWLKERVNSIL